MYPRGGGGEGRGHRGRGGGGRGNYRGSDRGRGGQRNQHEDAYRAWGVEGSDTNEGRQDPQQRRQRRTNQEYERKGPVFGFKRMYGFLTTDSNAVVLSICRDIESWKEFLTSEDLKSKTDLMAVVVQVLGNKVCSDDVTLQQQQVQILMRTFVQEFIAKLLEQCTAIIMGTSGSSQRRYNYNTENLMEVDSTPGTFLSNVFKYCNCVCKKMPETALDYLSQIVAPAYGAIMSISEGAGDGSLTDLREKFVELKSELTSLIKKREAKPTARLHRYDQISEELAQELHDMDAPDDYKQMPIIPTAKELLSREEVFLRPNITRGSYKNSLHYLDTQFRLLREDFVRPLRRGIQNFMQFKVDYLARKKKLPIGEIRIYPDVQIVNAELVREECVYKVQLPEETYKRIKWDKSKRLLTGSLLVFTQPPDFFQETFFAVVASRKVEELSKGLLSLTWEGRQPTWDKDEEYLMVECEVYFESYRHTLQTLKDLELDTFPMCKFIVEGSTDVRPPEYLETVRGMMQLKLEDGSTTSFSPLISQDWPSNEQLGLDLNQYVAFKAALTTQFAIIQGPPGTGKTFLGLKIAEVLLGNESAWKTETDGPIFVVCYTNHALDQFLEGILRILENETEEGQKFDQSSMIRVGGRSKSEIMQQFSLTNILRNKTLMQKMPRNYWPMRNEAMDNITDLRNARSGMMTAVMGLRDVQGIIDFEALDVFDVLRIELPSIIWKYFKDVSWFGFTEHLYQYDQYDVGAILGSWFDIKPTSGKRMKKVVANNHQQSKQPRDNGDDEDEEDYDVEELLAQRDLEDIWAEAESSAPANMGQHIRYISGFSIRDVGNELKKIDASIAQTRQEKDSGRKREQIFKLDITKQSVFKKLELLQEIFRLYREDRLDLPNVKPLIEQLKAEPGGFRAPNLQNLDRAKKWALFFEVVERARVLCAERVHNIEENLKKEQKNLHQIRRFGEGHILKGSKVVGMTTTGAAKYNDLVKMMESKIVIVEEAAEVLESHIVTCITKKCQHLILIGDHRQLRPNTTVYDLAKKYNLDISLFERMINNQLNCYQLKVQHRMRPVIANLVVGTVYKELYNHPSVTKYPEVMGVTESLYFFSHTELEKSDSDSMSKSNVFEANFLCALCRYLLLQGYEPHQITVLTTYTGQMFLLKKAFRSVPNCKDVKITCVDNFQGEENDIILLSLVRSNVDSKIGFLNVDNRVCVALSRAKHGLYIVGNMKMLAQKSNIWSQIQDKLTLRGQIGSSMFLECKIHGTMSEIHKEEDFRIKVPEGGCNQSCDSVLPCTHKCNKVCHTLDTAHKNYRCQSPCLRQCSNQHDCAAKCFKNPCPPCRVQMQKTLPCGHVTTMECFKDENTIDCTVVVQKVLPCGHQEMMACCKDPSEIVCKVEVDKEMPCKHRRTVQCHVDAASLTCKIQVIKTLPCGHQQEAECRFLPEVIKCETIVNKIIKECGHSRKVKCCDKEKYVTCVTPCQTRLSCGHACTRLCHFDDDPNHTGYKCKKDCARSCEGAHKCEAKHKCHTKCPPCNIEVERKLTKCGHVVRMSCSHDPLEHSCLFKCEKQLNCYHPCQNLCFQDCGPCNVPVKKRIRECTHAIEVPCNVIPDRNMCEILVKPVRDAACGHIDAEVPCKISLTVSSEEILKYCKRPCPMRLDEGGGGCGHPCSGTCSSCMQGRFHEKCNSQCGKTLVCGHICEFPCSKLCPPCGKDCMMKCEHSVCKQKCGTPCQDCNEKCPWQCPHKKCTKLCREMCDREPCDVPCPQILSCGHPCIGFCGEPCPPQCRICNKTELTEFQLFCTEEDDDARFVLLPDCGHAIEVEGLKHYMQMSQDEGEIGIKLCPRCRSVIKNCRRFNNIIKTRLKDVTKVKQRVFGNQRKVVLLQDRLVRKLRWESEDMKKFFPLLHEFLLGSISETVRDGRCVQKKVDEYTMDSINTVAKFAEEAVNVILKNKKDLRPELSVDLQNRYRQLFQKVMGRPFPLAKLELEDVSRELDRIFDLEQAYLRRSASQFGDGHARAQPIYDDLLRIILSPKPYAESNKAQLRRLIEQLEDVLRTGLGISEAEKRQILQAVGMLQGQWFKCPNGHIYVIGDCGGAMQQGTCNECGAAIGGGNHTLLRSNALASEMDGAVAPAWPSMLNR